MAPVGVTDKSLNEEGEEEGAAVELLPGSSEEGEEEGEEGACSLIDSFVTVSW